MCFFSNFFFFFHIYQIHQKNAKIQQISNFFHYKIYGNEGKKWICIKINNPVTRLIGQLPKIRRKNRRPIARDTLKLIQRRSRSVRLEFPWTLIKQRELLLNIQMPDKDLNQRLIRAVQQIDTRQNIFETNEPHPRGHGYRAFVRSFLRLDRINPLLMSDRPFRLKLHGKREASSFELVPVGRAHY